MQYELLTTNDTKEPIISAIDRYSIEMEPNSEDGYDFVFRITGFLIRYLTAELFINKRLSAARSYITKL